MRRDLTITLVLIASASQSFAYDAGSGESFDWSCNASGAALTNKATGKKLYLGKSCDAFSEEKGAGTWCWANGGFLATLDGGQYGFPHQELNCPEGGPAFPCICQ